MTLYNLNPDSLDGSSANEAACKNSYRRAKSLCGPKLVRDNSMTPARVWNISTRESFSQIRLRRRSPAVENHSVDSGFGR